ncbi:MAG: hypothetical protein JWR21_3783 [Herminiimonas sp.]|nr:hypothetical protein [Herminiimonas sp.]
MRLQSLDLIRYGKFTGEKLQFQRAEQDFHFVIGPNEAGKSTIRSAIADLLFGIPARSTLNFLHQLSELRLGAVLQHDSGLLAFQRAKANKNTLRDHVDGALPDSVLQDILGAADRAFFEQMYALDHQALIKGGNDILDARSGLGQILFQSAAGIDSLGRIHKSLAEEAEQIWTPRRAAGRKYYAAADVYEEASRQLKDATVRPQAWSKAAQELEEAELKLSGEKDQHTKLEVQRSRLERIRRTGPYLAAMKEAQEQLDALGDAVDLPEDASTKLTSAQEQIARAEPALSFCQTEVDRLQVALSNTAVNEKVINAAKEILELEESRSRFSAHHGDLVRRQQEVETLLADAVKLATQLGWAGNEAAVREALPGTLELARIATLVKDKGVLDATTDSATREAERKRAELARQQAELAAITTVEVSSGLAPALQDAQAYRQSASKLRALGDAINAATTELNVRLQALGPWKRDIAELRAMAVPASDTVAQQRTERQDLVLELRKARDSVEHAKTAVARSELQIAQCKESRHLVTAVEVSSARAARDSAWLELKTGRIALEAGASAVDQGIRESDQLADSHLGSVSQATELLSYQQQLAREMLDLAKAENTAAERAAMLAKLDAAWADKIAALRLGDMALDDLPAWLGRREFTVAAAAKLDQSQAELDHEQGSADATFDALREELRRSGVTVPDNVSALNLLALATDHVAAAQRFAAQREALSGQVEKGRAALADLQLKADESRAALDAWRNRWDQALSAVRLERFSDSVETVERAVGLVVEIQGKLAEAENIREKRINAMRADLDGFARDAQALAAQLEPAMVELDPAAIARLLAARLQTEQAAKKEASRLALDLSKAKKLVREAEETLLAARQRLAPLFELAGCNQITLLAPMIERSDQKRDHRIAVAKAKSELLAGGDGLPLPAIEAEVEAEDVSVVPALLERLKEDVRASIESQAELNRNCDAARRALDAIAGGEDAATAEAKRQEALSAMAEACERYIKVAAAGKLLKWAIDRYRDRKHGPLLTRAGEIFSGLTLGGFSRLTVDYDTQPVSLIAIRGTSQPVGIAAMSEGTRDQLFLALRLAALELQLGQAKPMPFIADDLFVNFDDERTKAGLRALGELSRKTQVIFLSHHDHMLPMVKEVFGAGVSVVRVGEGSEGREALVA